MQTKICLISGARSDWPLIEPLLDAARRQAVDAHLIVTGTHLSRRHGHTLDVILAAGWQPARRLEILEIDDSPLAAARSTGRAVSLAADALQELAPHWVVVAGDRYESFAAAVAATMLGQPLAHVGGGETDVATNQDGSLRNAITKLAHLHFVANTAAAQRIRALGEETWRIHAVGLPSLDALKTRRRPRTQLAPIGLPASGDFLLASFLPVTLRPDESFKHLDLMLDALDHIAQHKLCLLSNADAHADEHDARIRRWADGRRDATVVHSLPPELYATALAECCCYVGNSSSGVIESPVFGTPAVIVGLRQQGRLVAANTLALEQPTAAALLQAIRRQIAHGRFDVESPYGDGTAAARVLETLCRLRSRPDLLTKRLSCEADAPDSRPTDATSAPCRLSEPAAPSGGVTSTRHPRRLPAEAPP
ncbi:GDP/UDP-N,N'-diacetylbacillosamine 2-epimerase (hydrolyzing) [Phycisphaerae bacterium RAS1]|nr:GDP/UDP-N,N'-diacetylbacillosamine 2-epimerase (hydrolyzing) [Phycisphaerae bacterium RAS1]